jgi:hypothetical protein
LFSSQRKLKNSLFKYTSAECTIQYPRKDGNRGIVEDGIQ